MAETKSKAKLQSKGEHELEVARWKDQLAAYCSCGGWRYRADMRFPTAGAAYLYVGKWFEAHKKIMKRAA